MVLLRRIVHCSPVLALVYVIKVDWVLVVRVGVWLEVRISVTLNHLLDIVETVPGHLGGPRGILPSIDQFLAQERQALELVEHRDREGLLVLAEVDDAVTRHDGFPFLNTDWCVDVIANGVAVGKQYRFALYWPAIGKV